MNTHVDCISCVVNKANKLADKYILDKRQKHAYMKKVLQAIMETEYDRTAPLLDAKVMRVAKYELGVEDIYKEEKQYFNNKLLELEPEIQAVLKNSEDRLFDALKIASSGNIIDFSAVGNLNLTLVQNIMSNTFNNYFNVELYERLKLELSRAEHIIYLGDNTGEIVMDKLFIKEIKEQYPQVKVTFVTRGKPIFNDVTEEDAYYVGIDQYAEVINNGTDLPGTDLLEVSAEFKEVLQSADLIIAKGQGNFESLTGSGLNIYYIFLCKCDMIMNKLSAGRYANMFIAEKA
jgi:uncharacterized protein with ATP-grasp and redox domains